MNIMRAWDHGRNRVRFTRKSEHGKTIIDELKVEWFFYVRNRDYDDHEQFFRNVLNCNIVNKYFREQNYTRVYVDRAHNSDSLDMDMNFCWEYKDKLLNDLLLKMDGLGIPHFEADLPVWKRWMVSSGVQMETNLRTLFLDLETDNEKAKGQPIPGEFQILSCAFIDGETGKEAFVIAKDRTEEAEEELLLQIAKIINSYDVLIAFNGIAFDFAYLKVRLAKYGIILDWRKKHLQDHMRIFKKKGPKLNSYSLDSIAKFIVKRGKIEHDEPIFKLFLYNKGLLREYNLEDVRLMYDIERKTGFLAVDRELNAIGLCPCDDIYISRKIDQMILRRVYERGHFHFKTKERVEIIEEEQFEGAHVFEPILGLHYVVIVLDYTALYPNAIKTFRISPDTLITDDMEIDEKYVIRTPSGACFRKDVMGVLPELVGIISEGRKRYKDLMKTVQPGSSEHKSYDRLQYAFKELGLSFYGVCGMPYSRFFDKRVAEAITLSGQFFIKKTAEYLTANNIKIIYGDTDSLFILYANRDNIPKILKNIHKVCEHYAKTIFNADDCTLDMAFDKGFKNLILTSKKRYAGMADYLDDKNLSEPSLYIAGLEYKRTDSCLLLKKKQEALLRLLLKEQKPNIMEVHAFIKNLKSYVMSKEIQIEDFVFAQKLSKDEDDYSNPNLMHLQVMRQMKEDNKEVWVGDKIPYFIEDINFEGKPVPKPTYRYRGFFAREYYWNHKIYPALKRILEVVYKDIDWDQYDFRLSKSKMGKTITGRMDLF